MDGETETQKSNQHGLYSKTFLYGGGVLQVQGSGWDRVTFNPDCPGTCCAEGLPASTHKVLGLEMCTTMPGSEALILNWLLQTIFVQNWQIGSSQVIFQFFYI